MNHFLSDVQAGICITISIHICKFEHTVYTRVQVERVYKSNPIFEAKNTTFLEKV